MYKKWTRKAHRHDIVCLGQGGGRIKKWVKDFRAVCYTSIIKS